MNLVFMRTSCTLAASHSHAIPRLFTGVRQMQHLLRAARVPDQVLRAGCARPVAVAEREVVCRARMVLEGHHLHAHLPAPSQGS